MELGEDGRREQVTWGEHALAAAAAKGFLAEAVCSPSKWSQLRAASGGGGRETAHLQSKLSISLQTARLRLRQKEDESPEGRERKSYRAVDETRECLWARAECRFLLYCF